MNPEEIRELVRKEVVDAFEDLGVRALHPSQLTPKVIKQRHIEDVVIKFGLAADIPTDGGAVGVKAYFGTDNDTLSCWNGTAWVVEVLT